MPPAVEFATITEMFENVTGKYRRETRPALIFKNNGTYQGISYEELRTAVDECANGMAALGIVRSDTIAIVSENRPEWVIADMAMMKLGAVSVSVYPTLVPKQIAYILINAGVKLIFASNQLQLGKIKKIAGDVPTLKNIVVMSERANLPEEKVIPWGALLAEGRRFGTLRPGYLSEQQKKTQPEDLLTIIYTSGTTGNPKGVMLTHRNLVTNMRSAADCIPFTHEDTLLSYLPFSHSYERMAGYYTAMSCGAQIAFAESIEKVQENLLEVRPTVVTTVPRLFERFHTRIMNKINDGPPLGRHIFFWAVGVGRKYRNASPPRTASRRLALEYRLADMLIFRKIRQRTGGRIRFFVSGGAALPPHLGEFFDAIGIPVIEGYGMTECSPVISVNRLESRRFGTVGKPLPGVEVMIATDGEICVRGPNVMAGYWRNDAATREIIDSQGWLHTGDIGSLDSDGYLTITDRKKHLFVSSGGKNIAPQHIEDLFLQSHLIEQFVLIGDGRMFLSGLIIPNFDQLKDFASQHGVSYSGLQELVSHPEVSRLMEGELARIQQDLAGYERVRKFTILSKPLSIENGEITPTLKVRRKVVEEHFRDIIEKMYAGM
jgi:long-chain acyl-CoA synthetase